MTDRELLESLMKKMIDNQSQLSNIELKMNLFIKEYKEILYGYGRNGKTSSK